MRYLLIAVLFVCATPLHAALLRYEPFNYTPAGDPVEGKMTADGGTWLTAYASTAPDSIKVASGNLSVPSGIPSPVGNSAVLDGTGNGAGKAIRLPLGGGVNVDSGGTIYFSLALKVKDLVGSNTTTGGFFLALNNSATASTSNPTSAAARLQGRIDPADATKYNLGIFRNVNATAAATSWSGPLSTDDTLFLVGSYEAKAGLQNDIARLWINPNPATFGDLAFSPGTTPPTLIDNTTGTGTDIGVFSLLLRQGPAPRLTLDELRIGDSWASVTSATVPEPCSWAMLGIIGGALAVRKRTRPR